MSKQIQLTKGYVSIVDDEDFDWLSEFKWCVDDGSSCSCYALSWIRGKIVKMHRAIMFHHGLLEDDLLIDHIDGNGLNNQKDNLRACTNAENLRNRKGPFRNGYQGICRSGYEKNPWKARICVGGKRIHLGVFPTKKAAAKAYDKAALELHGEFATVNFPQ